MAQLQTSEIFAHGIFFFGPHSQEVDLIPNYDPKFNSIQLELLDDDDDDKIDIEKEKERCARYGLEILNQTDRNSQPDRAEATSFVSGSDSWG